MATTTTKTATARTTRRRRRSRTSCEGGDADGEERETKKPRGEEKEPEEKAALEYQHRSILDDDFDDDEYVDDDDGEEEEEEEDDEEDDEDEEDDDDDEDDGDQEDGIDDADSGELANKDDSRPELKLAARPRQPVEPRGKYAQSAPARDAAGEETDLIYRRTRANFSLQDKTLDDLGVPDTTLEQLLEGLIEDATERDDDQTLYNRFVRETLRATAPESDSAEPGGAVAAGTRVSIPSRSLDSPAVDRTAPGEAADDSFLDLSSDQAIGTNGVDNEDDEDDDEDDDEYVPTLFHTPQRSTRAGKRRRTPQSTIASRTRAHLSLADKQLEDVGADDLMLAKLEASRILGDDALDTGTPTAEDVDESRALYVHFLRETLAREPHLGPENGPASSPRRLGPGPSTAAVPHVAASESPHSLPPPASDLDGRPSSPPPLDISLGSTSSSASSLALSSTANMRPPQASSGGLGGGAGVKGLRYGTQTADAFRPQMQTVDASLLGLNTSLHSVLSNVSLPSMTSETSLEVSQVRAETGQANGERAQANSGKGGAPSGPFTADLTTRLNDLVRVQRALVARLGERRLRTSAAALAAPVGLHADEVASENDIARELGQAELDAPRLWAELGAEQLGDAFSSKPRNPHCRARNGRLLFTASEDKLLARGIARFGRNAWDEIARTYLVGKKSFQLDHRVHNHQKRQRLLARDGGGEASSHGRSSAAAHAGGVVDAAFRADQQPCESPIMAVKSSRKSTPAAEWLSSANLDRLATGLALAGEDFDGLSARFLPHVGPQVLGDVYRSLVQRIPETAALKRFVGADAAESATWTPADDRIILLETSGKKPSRSDRVWANIKQKLMRERRLKEIQARFRILRVIFHIKAGRGASGGQGVAPV